MGNSLTSQPCFSPSPDSPVTLIIHDGTKRRLPGRKDKPWMAGEVMFDFPGCMVCHADSFFIGHRVPALGAHDELAPGDTYFVLPVDDSRKASCSVVSASMLAGLSPGSRPGPVRFGARSPFQYVKGPDGRLVIKVAPEFIERIIAGGGEEEAADGGVGLICSTPELQKRYDQVVVRCRENVWAPKLETISESKINGFSACRLMGLDRKHNSRRSRAADL